MTYSRSKADAGVCFVIRVSEHKADYRALLKSAVSGIGHCIHTTKKKIALSRVGDGGRDVGFDSAPMPIHT